jgi:hypothetical protein
MIIIIKILPEKEWNTLLIKAWLKIKRRDDDDDDDEYGGDNGNDSDDDMRLWLKIDVDIC